MEIFFCETCGRRVTDAEIEAGQGIRTEDGVYCPECAKGHVTEARESAPPPASVRPRRRRASSSSRARVSTRDEPGGGSQVVLALLVGGVVFVIVILAFVVFSQKEKKPEFTRAIPPPSPPRPAVVPKETGPAPPTSLPPAPQEKPPRQLRQEKRPAAPAVGGKTPKDLWEEKMTRGEIPQPRQFTPPLSSPPEGYSRPGRWKYHWDFESGLAGWGGARYSSGGVTPGKKCIVIKGKLGQAWGKEYTATAKTCIQILVYPAESFEGLQIHCWDETKQDNARYKIGRTRLTPGKWTAVRLRCTKLWFWSSGEGVPAVAAGHQFKSLGFSVTGEAAFDEVYIFEEE